MATWVVEARVASPGGSWTTVSEVIAFVFREEINNLYRAQVTVVNPPTAVELLLVRDNELRIRETDAPKEWYRGKIRDVTADPLTSIFNVSALGVAVVLHDRSWIGRREFPVVPAEISADELAHSLNGEPRAGQNVHYDMETLTNDSPAKMKDLSSGGNDGTISGPLSVTGKWGLGRDYAAESDEIVITSFNYDGVTAFGHGAHVRIANSFPTRTTQTIYGAHTSGANAQGSLRLKSAAGGLPTSVDLLINTATQGFQTVARPFTFVLGQVYHIYGTWDGSEVRIYIDGVQQGTGTTASGALVSGPSSHFIGHFASSAVDTETFADFIDNITSYDRAISADEIKVLAGRNILPGHNGTMDSFTAIGFRSEEEKRGVTIETLARSVGAEVFVDQNASDENRFNFVDRIGSASPTDTFKFGETAVLASRKVDSESIYNDISVLGFGDGINQLKSRNFHATTIRSTVAVRQSASASTLDLADASTYPTSGIIQAGRERERYTGKTGNQLTGISGANRAYDADGYESIAAYAHEVGIEVFLHADTTTSPDTYYTPEVPQTGSSIDDNGWRQAPYPAPELVDQNATDRLAQRFLAKYKDERESVVLHVYEEAIVADLGDDVDVQNLDGSAYENSPYRIAAMEFKWPTSRWELELANYRDTVDRRMAELGEKMRIANEFGQGATNFYPLYVAENIKGGVRHAIMDVTIPSEALAVNSVKITRLRLRPFETYTGAGGAAHAHDIPQTDINVAEVEDVAAESTVVSAGINSWWTMIGAVISLTNAAQYVHATMMTQLSEDARKGSARLRLRKEVISWASLRAIWPMDLSNPTSATPDLNPTVFWDISGNIQSLTVQSSGQFITMRDAPSVADPSLADVGQSCLNFNTPLSFPHHLSRSTGDAGGLPLINDNTGTLAFWVRLDSLASQMTLFSCAEEGATGDEWNLSFRGDLSNQLQVTLRINGSTTVELRSSTTVINDTDWHHVIITSNGSTLAMYLDGAAQSIQVITGSNNGPWFGDATDANVCAWGVIRRATLTRPLDGGIDDAYVFSRVITSAERTAIRTEDVYFPRGTGMPWDPSTFAEMSMRSDLAVDMGTSAELLVKAPAETGRNYSFDIFWDPISGDGGGLINIHGQLVLVSYIDSFPAATTDTETGHTHPADLIETAYTSPSVSLFIDGVDKTSVVKPAGPYTADTSNIDLTKAIEWTEGVHTVEFREGTTDKLGRIHASGFVQTFLKSA